MALPSVNTNWTTSTAPRGSIDAVYAALNQGQLPVNKYATQADIPFMGMQQNTWQDELSALPWGKIAGIGALAGSGIAAYGAYQQMGETPQDQLTAESVRKLISSMRSAGAQQINRSTSQGIQDMGSQYAARGLGSSGAVAGDISGLRVAGQQAKTQLNANLDQQLLALLQYIDQRNAAQQAQENAARSGFLGNLADLGMTIAPLLL